MTRHPSQASASQEEKKKKKRKEKKVQGPPQKAFPKHSNKSNHSSPLHYFSCRELTRSTDASNQANRAS